MIFCYSGVFIKRDLFALSRADEVNFTLIDKSSLIVFLVKSIVQKL